jgi:hypothetical protein
LVNSFTNHESTNSPIDLQGSPMSFLDRFKLQPKYRSADPDVRISAVQDLGDGPDDAALLAAIAREDAEPRVRRAAAARVEEVAVLAALMVSDADEGLRSEISVRLAGVAASDNADGALQAVSALTDQRQLAEVAQRSPHAPIRMEALSRVSDLKALSSIARKGADPRVASAAVDRVQDPAELLNIAVKTDHKDAGVSALERAIEMGGADRDTLESVAARARNKSVAKRARSMVQAMDDAETARRAAVDLHNQRLAGVLARAEALAQAAATAAPEQADDLEREWRELLTGAPVDIGTDDDARFRGRIADVREGIAQAERDRAAARERDEQLARVRDARTAICERLEAIAGEDALDRIAEARAEWEGLPADAHPADPELLARFESACQHATARHENRQEFARANSRLEELSREAEQLAAQENGPAYVWESISREWNDLRSRTEGVDDAVAARFAEAERTIRERADAKRAAAERAVRQQVQRIEQLIDRAQKRAAAEDLTLKEAEKAARDLRGAIEAPLAVPAAERDALIERVKTALGVLGPRLHELREMDEWKRFANAAVQEELIAQTEALKTKYDWDNAEMLEKAAHELHEIQERWKTVAEAPRAQAQTLWHRYRQAADPLQAKAREFFAHRAEERQTNLANKLALCERAEALADSTDWIKTADELKKLQAEWQKIGPVPRSDTRDVWKRFREACDRFFSRRNEDLAQRKEVWSTNQARKEALCARAEELADSKDWERTASEIRRLQAEWKTVGPVRRNKSEALWQRFRTACDRFFDRYKRRDEIELESRQADREALAVELESLMPAPDAPPSSDLLERVRSLRTRWNQSTSGVRQGADPLSGRFVSAMERLLTSYPDAFRNSELDIDASRQRMEKLVARVEEFASQAAAKEPGTTHDLASMLREALAANTIGGRGSDETKWRGMADEVRQSQASFARLVPVPGETGRQLAERFQKACNRFFDLYRKHTPQQQTRRPVGTR